MVKVKSCFVCKSEVTENDFQINKEVNLPVCNKCQGSEDEKKEVESLLDSLADDLICGCI